ncbi:alpha/beta hydrolase [Nocardia brasiliensis]|uniref:Esterase n=1 Tax=Nocardia brasiliensis (strain ATCC 700358 / HUJEG-1) TaxID=1133849 RepID=K0EMK2_NOCB7|nr:alpha/beta hydrolase [Nocardia brasiliensis]AFT98134.1 esterase [Nocardia brasiliensis ATCC 700358]OCF90813.1 esterase [Nocardia brasiliensis]
MAASRVGDPGMVMNPENLSAPARLLLAACLGVIRPALRAAPITRATIPIGAAAIDTLARLRPEPTGIDRERVSLNGFRMEIIRPAGAARALRHGAMLYMHGGGFAVCGLRTHRPVAASLARRTGLPVVNVDYRQLPGRRITDSVEDCLTAYRWLLAHGADPGRIVFAGDSAGGYLTFATALRALAEGLPAPAGLVGLSPLLDLDYAAKRGHVNVRRDPYIPLLALAAVVRIGAEVDGELDPLLSPVNGILAGLPPVLLIAAEDEVLRYDCELMAQRLTAAGVPNAVELWRGQVHAFMSIAPNLPESRAALARVSRFVRARIEESQQARTA